MDTVKKILAAFIFMGLLHPASAQDTAKNKQILQFFEAIKKANEKTLNLGFTVKYVYTDEQQPQKIIDSLTGTYRISGKNYWFRMAATETMKNDSLVIMLFSDDKMMYVRKAALQAGFDPMEQMRVFLENHKTISSKIVRSKKYDELIVSFPEGMDYKSISLSVDNATGYLSKSVYVMRTKLLTNNADETAEGAGDYSEYAKVIATYSNYNTDTVASLFDEKRFIERKDKKITTTEQYRDYKIFFGSSNL